MNDSMPYATSMAVEIHTLNCQFCGEEVDLHPEPRNMPFAVAFAFLKVNKNTQVILGISCQQKECLLQLSKL